MVLYERELKKTRKNRCLSRGPPADLALSLTKRVSWFAHPPSARARSCTIAVALVINKIDMHAVHQGGRLKR
jgi:hypothetical protein